MRFCLLVSAVFLLGETAGAWPHPLPSWPESAVRRDLHGDLLPAGALARLGAMRFRHSSPVTSLVFAPDGKRLISASVQGDVSVWDVKNGREIRRWHDSSGTKKIVGFSPDGKLMARTEDAGTCLILNLETGEIVARLNPTNPTWFAFSPDNKLLASPGGVWEIGSGKKLCTLESNARGPLLFLPGGKTLAFVSGSIGLLELASKKNIRIFGSAGDCLAVAPDGKIIASRVSNHLQLYNTATGKEIRLMQPKEGGICAIIFSPDGNTVVTGDGATHILLWNPHTGELVGQLDGHMDWVTCLAFSPDGKYLASGGRDHTVRIWDIARRKQINVVDSHQAPNLSVQFLPDGKTLASWCDKGYPTWTPEGAIIRFWDTASGKKTRHVTWKPGPGSPYWWGKPFSMSRDARHFALGEQTGKVRLKDLTVEKELGVLDHPQGHIHSMRLSTDSSLLAVVTNMRQRGADGGQTLHMWNIARKHKIWHTVLSQSGERNWWFSEDGRMLANYSTSGNGVHLQFRMARTGKVFPQQIMVGERGAWAWSPSSRLIATAGTYRYQKVSSELKGKEIRIPRNFGSQIVLHELASGSPIRTLNGPEHSTSSLAFSPDSRFLAAGHDDGQIWLWDVLAGKELGRLRGQRGAISSLSFSADGKKLASAANDVTVLVWDCSSILKSNSAAVKPLSEKELQSLWLALKSSDPAGAYQAIDRLIRSPTETISLLEKHLRPVAPPDPRRLADLIGQLDSNLFDVRRNASAELEKFGDLAGPALADAQKNNPSLEARRRLDRLLLKLDDPGMSPDWLQKVRALEVLEYLGSNSAKSFLQRLARGALGARLTQEVLVTLERWKQ